MSRNTLLATVAVAVVLGGAGVCGAATDANLPAGVEARFIGVRYDAGNTIYMPDGRTIVENEYIPFWPISWDQLLMRRDFIFEFRPGSHKLVVARDAGVEATNGRCNAHSAGMTMEYSGQGWFRVSFVTQIQRGTDVYTPGQPIRRYVPEAMDVTVSFYCPDNEFRSFEFKGPFADKVESQSVAGGHRVLLSSYSTGKGDEGVNCWVMPRAEQGWGRPGGWAMIVAQDKNGKRHTLELPGISQFPHTGGDFILKGCRLDDIVSMSVTMPYEVRATNVDVRDRGGRIVDHAAYLDVMNERLKQGDTPQALASRRLNKLEDLANLTDIPAVWVMNVSKIQDSERFHDANAFSLMRATARKMLASRRPLIRAGGGRMAAAVRDETQMDGILGVIERGYLNRSCEPLAPHLLALEPECDGEYRIPLYEAGAAILDEIGDWRGLSADSAGKLAKMLPAVREPFLRKRIRAAIDTSQDNGYKAYAELVLNDDPAIWRWAAEALVGKSSHRLDEWSDMPEKARERLTAAGWSSSR